MEILTSMNRLQAFLLPCLFVLASNTLHFGQSEVLEPMNVFDLEFISDPQISPAGDKIVYLRNSKDVMTDGNLSNIWITDFEGTTHRPLTTGSISYSQPRWSPDGQQLAYLSNKDGNRQIYVYWLDSQLEHRLTNLTTSPGSIQWSPDGKWIAFTMQVKAEKKELIKMPPKPKGAEWAKAPVYIDKMKFKSDGAGFLKNTYRHLFVVSTEGGTPRQLTSGNYNHSGAFSWTPDSKYLIFSANRNEDREFEGNNSEVYELDIASTAVRQLTTRKGPDNRPKVSPNGSKIAYTGFDEQYLGYQQSKLYVMNRDGSNPKLISGGLDRIVSNVQWIDDETLYFQYDDQGNTKIARIKLDGSSEDLTNNVGGLSLGRPYSGGSFTVAKNGRYAFTHSEPDHPADLAVGIKNKVQRLTNVNADLFDYKQLGQVEEVWFNSAYDNRKIQGWICKPPNFDPTQKYPLILEIHGGPFANYGWRFSTEVQLYAAAGYVVLYTNPRGSSSYGSEFGNLIHHNYPNQDYDDLMSGVDALIDRGYIDKEQLFVTGGSGGGVLTAWIVGKTDRFRAAVVAKPVINWYSFVLHADNPAFFYRYWFPGFPWDHQEHYMKRSPISLVGNVKTPTMLLTGEQDYRTPMSETEQYYTALKLNKVESALVRIQEAGHGIAAKPSNLMAKVLYILGWFERYGKGERVK